ncbi:MAG TPA: YcaO-like family protein, partial [Streptomyces sp.]|nr:YcaO-like family protein [Streptomyces sp.]
RLGMDALPAPVVAGLHRRGLVGTGGFGQAHPLYGDDNGTARSGRGVVVAGRGPVYDAVRALLGKAGVRVRSAASPASGPAGKPPADVGVGVVPLDLGEAGLGPWARWSAGTGLPVVTYLSTPTRLLLATLDPPRTPCPVCLVLRIRANHAWQQIADLPLDVLLGAADSDTWATTAIAAGFLAHTVMTLLSGSALPEEPPALIELDHTSPEVLRHPLFHTPSCPACPADVAPARTSAAGQDSAPGSDSRAEWHRLQRAVDPLTGLVPELRLEKDDRRNGTTHVYTVGKPTTTWFSPVQAEGRGGAAKQDPDLARVCAVGEALERYAAGVYDPGRLVRSTLGDLGPAAVDPRSLPLGSAAEYARQTKYAPFDPDVAIDWVKGVSLTTGAERYLPACAVYLPYRFPPGHRAWFAPISNGLAAGRDVEHAALGGLLEVVERDAAIVWWENRLALPTVDLDGLGDGPARQVLARLSEAGVQVSCKDLTTDLGIPAAAVRLIEERPGQVGVAHAARADMDMHAAVLGALEEACLVQAGIDFWLKEKSIPEPDQVLSELEDFCLYYCAPDRLHHLAFWDDGPLRPLPPARPGRVSSHTDLQEAVGRLAAAGYEAITVDITPIDVAECGVSVVRTVVPGLCPLTLDSRFRRRGGPRVFQAPVAMGVRTTPLTEDDLNPLPLPFP